MDKNLLGGSTVLMLLSLLSEGDRYGYDIIRELAARSENVFQMREGSLYPVLHRRDVFFRLDTFAGFIGTSPGTQGWPFRDVPKKRLAFSMRVRIMKG